jgi:hypothetical protein
MNAPTSHALLQPAWHERAVAKDASALSDCLLEQELLARQIADGVQAARPVKDAIEAIKGLDFTPDVAAQIAVYLAAKVRASEWSHLDLAEHACQRLDDAHDTFEDVV